MNLVFIIIYLALQVGIAYAVSKSIKTEKDFFLAGKDLPLWLLSFSLFATWFGAETCLGTSGAVYKEGLSGSRSDPFGYTLCLFFLGLFLTKKLWEGGYTTIADFFRLRFDKRVETLAILILVPSSLIWGSAQMRAFAQVVSSMTNWDLDLTLWIAFSFVTFYTLLGGLLGDILTDLVQGIIIAVGLVALLIYVVASDFSVLHWWQNLPVQKLSFTLPGENFLQRLDRWAIPVFGSLVAQELISRVLSARSVKVAQRSAYVSSIIYLFFGSIPVILGLFGPELVSDLSHHEDFMIVLARQYMPPLGYIIFSGAIISAILATIDSILLSAAALVSHNLVVPYFKITNEKTKIRSARIIVVISSLLSVTMAFSSDSIYQLVELASSFGTAGVLVITLCGLHFQWGNSQSALYALLAGLIALPVAKYILQVEAPFIATLLISFSLYVLAGFQQKSLAKIPTST